MNNFQCLLNQCGGSGSVNKSQNLTTFILRNVGSNGSRPGKDEINWGT